MKFTSGALIVAFTVAPMMATENFDWEKLPPIPDSVGFAAPFAGVSHGALIVAGGANFPAKPPWEGGVKVWHDSVFVLEQRTGAWKSVTRLPRPLAYGLSITHGNQIICIGGSDSKRHYSEVFAMTWKNGEIETIERPGLPRPLANFSGALLNNTIYCAGGTETPDATNASKFFIALSPQPRFLESWPGRERILAIAGTFEGSFYLFGGAALKTGPDGKPVREWLRDCHRFTPGKGWQRIADLPSPVVAAPSPALVSNGKLLILGGDDGSQLKMAPDEHRGFSRTILAYDPASNTWSKVGETPFAFVTTTCVHWDNRFVIPGGEIRPGVRSAEVWATHAK